MKLLWKETLKSLLIIFILIIISSLIINVLYYNDIISNTLLKFIKIIFIVLSMFIGGIIMGKNSPNKGYLYGFRLSILVIILFLLFGIIFDNIKGSRIIFYLITIFTITFGSMLGINKKNS